MIEADSVLSTPRETASKIVEFPKRPAKPAKRKSAIANVKRSGYELVLSHKVPKDTGKGKRLTDSEVGRMDFKAWEKNLEDMEPIDGEHWHARGVDVRFAHAVMLMSKEQLINFPCDGGSGSSRYPRREHLRDA